MDAETTQEERQVEWSGEAPSLESLRELRMTALLNDVVDELGPVKAAKKLGVDRKTLWRCTRMGHLTPRMSDALERLLLSRDLSEAMQQGKRVDALAERVAALERERQGGLEAVVGEVKAMREEHDRERLQVERRLLRLESGRHGPETPSPSIPEPDSKRREVPRRTYPQLVTVDAEPGEDLVYGEATPVIVEWRTVREESRRLLKSGPALARTEVHRRMLELEIALIGEQGLTLPPTSYPWDWAERDEQVWDRKQVIKRVRMERNWALMRLWLRRIVTCGLWRN